MIIELNEDVTMAEFRKAQWEGKLFIPQGLILDQYFNIYLYNKNTNGSTKLEHIKCMAKVTLPPKPR